MAFRNGSEFSSVISAADKRSLLLNARTNGIRSGETVRSKSSISRNGNTEAWFRSHAIRRCTSPAPDRTTQFRGARSVAASAVTRRKNRYPEGRPHPSAFFDSGVMMSDILVTRFKNRICGISTGRLFWLRRIGIAPRLKISWNQYSIWAFRAVKGGFSLDEQAIAILVVDDEPLLRVFAVDFLTDAGFKVYEASNADEAVEVLGSRPDIFAVFTDIQMSGTMDGIGLAQRIKKSWPGIFVIVTSGHQAPESGELSDDVPFLTKPYLPETVATMIRQKLSPQIVHSPVSE